MSLNNTFVSVINVADIPHANKILIFSSFYQIIKCHLGKLEWIVGNVSFSFKAIFIVSLLHWHVRFWVLQYGRLWRMSTPSQSGKRLVSATPTVTPVKLHYRRLVKKKQSFWPEKWFCSLLWIHFSYVKLFQCIKCIAIDNDWIHLKFKLLFIASL